MRIYQKEASTPFLFARRVFGEALLGEPIERLQTLLLVAHFHAPNPVCEVFYSSLERWADEYQVWSSYLGLVCRRKPALGARPQ